MSVVSARQEKGRGASAGGVALAVLDANWFSTENLFREVRREGVSTLLVKCVDYVNAWRRGERPWSWGGALRSERPGLWERDLVLPSGWMKTFPRLGMRPIGRTIRGWRRRGAGGAPLALVMTYPHYLYVRGAVAPARTVYYNLDDYALYWPEKAEDVRALELRAVRESDLTVCVSRARAEGLRSAVPEAAGRVVHLPHGAPTSMLADRPWDLPAFPPDDLTHLPRPLLGYVGSLDDRVDWPLVSGLSSSFPAASVVLIGRAGVAPAGGPAWAEARRECLSRPNVHAIGWRPQADIPRYYRAFDVCLIPYDVSHPFNQACSPTKIMDCMATGRPVVTSALPECLLYTDLIEVAGDAATFVSAVGSILGSGSDDGRALDRWAHARRNSCAAVADRFMDLLTL